MKRLGKLAVCFAGGLVLNASLRADDAMLPANPYTAIVVRNVFGLNPPKPADDAPPADPPPKITPNGIMSIFGQLQVLFKVAPKPGQQGAKEESYVLSEGQAQDDIEVVHINEKDGVVTFNNHGTEQQIPLVNTPASSTPASTPTQITPIPNPNFPRPFGGPGRLGGRPGSFGGPAATQNRSQGSGMNTGFGGGTVGGGYSGQSSQASQQSQMTPEETALMIEAQREYYQSQSDPRIKSMAGILPPTVGTPPEATGPTGNPLVISPP